MSEQQIYDGTTASTTSAKNTPKTDEIYGKVVVIKRTGQDSASFELIDDSYTFGRAAECDIRIQLLSIAEQHCKISRNEFGHAVLTKLSEEAGLLVNNSVLNEDSRVLEHNDILTLVERSFRYEFTPEMLARSQLANQSASMSCSSGSIPLTSETPKKPSSLSGSVFSISELPSSPSTPKTPVPLTRTLSNGQSPLVSSASAQAGMPQSPIGSAIVDNEITTSPKLSPKVFKIDGDSLTPTPFNLVGASSLGLSVVSSTDDSDCHDKENHVELCQFSMEKKENDIHENDDTVAVEQTESIEQKISNEASISMDMPSMDPFEIVNVSVSEEYKESTIELSEAELSNNDIMIKTEESGTHDLFENSSTTYFCESHQMVESTEEVKESVSMIEESVESVVFAETEMIIESEIIAESEMVAEPEAIEAKNVSASNGEMTAEGASCVIEPETICTAESKNVIESEIVVENIPETVFEYVPIAESDNVFEYTIEATTEAVVEVEQTGLVTESVTEPNIPTELVSESVTEVQVMDQFESASEIVETCGAETCEAVRELTVAQLPLEENQETVMEVDEQLIEPVKSSESFVHAYESESNSAEVPEESTSEVSETTVVMDIEAESVPVAEEAVCSTAEQVIESEALDNVQNGPIEEVVECQEDSSVNAPLEEVSVIVEQQEATISENGNEVTSVEIKSVTASVEVKSMAPSVEIESPAKRECEMDETSTPGPLRKSTRVHLTPAALESVKKQNQQQSSQSPQAASSTKRSLRTSTRSRVMTGVDHSVSSSPSKKRSTRHSASNGDIENDETSLTLSQSENGSGKKSKTTSVSDSATPSTRRSTRSRIAK